MATDPNADDGTHGRSIRFSVHDRSLPVVGAICVLYHGPADQSKGRQRPVAYEATGESGEGVFRKLKPGLYTAYCLHQRLATAETVLLEAGETPYARFELSLGMSARITLLRDGAPNSAVAFAHEGDVAELAISFERDGDDVVVVHPTGAKVEAKDTRLSYSLIRSAGQHQLHFSVLVPLSPRQLEQHPEAVPLRAPPDNRARISDQRGFSAEARVPQTVDGNLAVSLQRGNTTGTPDLAFWQGILNSTEQMGFNNYLRFMNMLFCGDEVPSDLPVFERERFDEKRELSQRLFKRRLLPFTDSDAYRAVKAATEAFVMVNCGVLAEPRPFDERRDAAHLRRRDLPVPFGGLENVFTEDYLVQIMGGAAGDRTLPYLAVIRSKLPDIAIKLESLGVDPQRVGQCTGILQEKLTHPCMLELIWSYWHEEGMLVQTMNSIARRFQNVRSGERDPLANLEIDPLRPLNNVLWGYVQDEQHRLSIVRRNYEYDHHYGLRLEGKAVARMQAADSRSRFIEAFHSLLRYCTSFYRQDDDTTVKADAFPVLNALKEVHLILSQGAHNQFGDLPSTARIEMLMQQWMLARPEFREFLPTRIMTAYPEPWMDRVDAMKKVQGWTDTSVLHFRNLAKFGEQLLLSIRWGHWSDVQDPLQAFNWARFFRPQAQGYCHAYRAVTGVELALEASDAKVDATLPSVLLQRRLATQQRAA